MPSPRSVRLSTPRSLPNIHHPSHLHANHAHPLFWKVRQRIAEENIDNGITDKPSFARHQSDRFKCRMLLPSTLLAARSTTNTPPLAKSTASGAAPRVLIMLSAGDSEAALPCPRSVTAPTRRHVTRLVMTYIPPNPASVLTSLLDALRPQGFPSTQREGCRAPPDAPQDICRRVSLSPRPTRIFYQYVLTLIVRIAHGVSSRKRVGILSKARSLGVKVP